MVYADEPARTEAHGSSVAKARHPAPQANERADGKSKAVC